MHRFLQNQGALIMVTVGAAIGIPAALALAKFGSFFLPARRASRIDPGIALPYQ